ncbi:MAG: cysteine desulfurase family protein [Acidobacteriota bacterium]
MTAVAPLPQTERTRPSDSEGVYLDHNATTPVDPRVRDAMWPHFLELHGNPSSSHRHGRRAKEALEGARAQVASVLGADADAVHFTASGTEANNAVVAAVTAHHRHTGRLLVNTLEHPSIHAACARAADAGMAVDEVVPNADGVVDAEALLDAVRPDTRLVCLMLANNELGTLQPVAEVAGGCRKLGVPVLCDAVQAVGKIKVNVGELSVDYLSIGGHKCYGPPGVAALWTRPGAVSTPLLVGGSQEAGRRASTENVPAIVGLGAAAELAERELADRHRHMRALRDRFEAGLPRGARVHGGDAERLPNTSHVAFDGAAGHHTMLWLDGHGFAVSTGSACHAGEPQASRALLAMGVDRREALGSLRISFGVTNTEGDVDRFLEVLRGDLPRLPR